MTTKVEVEVRGPLNKEKFQKLKEFLDKNAKNTGKKDRLTLIYFRDYIPKDVSEIKDEKVDLRLRITNKKAEVVMKHGSFGGSDSRKEYSFFIPLEKFEEMAEFLKCLGWKLCVINATQTYVYEYKDIKFALVDIKGFGSYFEAEILINEGEDIQKAKNQILESIENLKLKEFTEEEFNSQCDAVNNTKELQFNFDKESVSIVKEKFPEFF